MALRIRKVSSDSNTKQIKWKGLKIKKDPLPLGAAEAKGEAIHANVISITFHDTAWIGVEVAETCLTKIRPGHDQ